MHLHLSPYNYANSVASQAKFSPQNNRKEIISPPPPLFFSRVSFLINIQKGKEFNLSAMVGIQGGREGKMGVKTFILQRVQPPLCL